MCPEHPLAKVNGLRYTCFLPETTNTSRVGPHLCLIYLPPPLQSLGWFSTSCLMDMICPVFISVFTVLEVGTLLQCSPFFLLGRFPPFWDFILLAPLVFQNLPPLPVLQGQASCFSHYVSLPHPPPPHTHTFSRSPAVVFIEFIVSKTEILLLTQS